MKAYDYDNDDNEVQVEDLDENEYETPNKDDKKIIDASGNKIPLNTRMEQENIDFSTPKSGISKKSAVKSSDITSESNLTPQAKKILDSFEQKVKDQILVSAQKQLN